MGLLSNYKYDVYLAGPFFTPVQKETMDIAKTVLQGKGLIVCDPRDLSPVLVDMPPEERKKHTRSIFVNNISAMDESYGVIACIDDRDTGTAFELGYFFANFKTAEQFGGVWGPIITFSGFGHGANVMLSEATDAHFISIAHMAEAMDVILPALRSLGEQPENWKLWFSEIFYENFKAEATE